jgi:L-lactate dehydrogenase (cytochrome)
MNPAKTTCIEDLRRIAERRVPRMFYQYCDSGSWTESTYRANESDFQRIKFRQRVMADNTERSLATTMLGMPVSMPVALAPTGSAGMQHADGEILAARAAAKAGVPFVLSTMSICSIEDVARATKDPFWFQLYVRKDRDFARNLILRAKAAGCPVLVLTVDLQILAQRNCDLRNGLSAPPRPTIPNILNMITKPRWCLGMLGTRHHGFGNIAGHAKGVSTIRDVAAWATAQDGGALTWDDIGWIRDLWGGKLILKGILDPEDADRAAGLGADALVVSNHGGRQLDGTLSTIAALPGVLDAVAGRTEVHLDGGIRSGMDVLRAIALGAKSTYIGRPFLYGLGAGGEAGVTRCLDIIRKELDQTLALCGLKDIREAGPEIIAENPFGTPAMVGTGKPAKPARKAASG